MKNKIPFRAIIAVILTLCTVTAVFTAYFLKSIFGGIKFKSFAKLSYIASLVDKEALYDVDYNKAEKNIINGYLDATNDKYATYYDASLSKTQTSRLKGKSFGLGINIVVDSVSDDIFVWRVFANSSAQKAGLKQGDRITNINNKSVKELGYTKAVKSLQSAKEGKSILLTVKRNNSFKNIKIKYSQNTIQSVFYNKIKPQNLGYIQITSFNTKTHLQFKAALDCLKNENIKGLIIDLRHNGGGTVSSCAEITDMLVGVGDTVITKDKNGEKTVWYKSDKEKLNLPIVVLGDSKTASASEIMISALKDIENITFIGTKTFGKGIIQRNFLLPDNSSVKFTVAKYVNSKGESYHKKGISPDIKVNVGKNYNYYYYFLNRSNDVILNKAIEYF